MKNSVDTGELHKASLVVIAIGGNSLIKDDQHRTVLDQYNAVGETARHIIPIVSEGYRVVVTHGNGPQVGFILLRSDLAREVLHQAFRRSNTSSVSSSFTTMSRPRPLLNVSIISSSDICPAFLR